MHKYAQRFLLVLCLLVPFLAGCKQAASVPPGGIASCSDPYKVVESFYTDNDSGDYQKSLDLLDDDVVLVAWAEGANGHHMTSIYRVGKDNVAQELGDPGLRRAAASAGQPNFKEQNLQVMGNIVHFELMPDRLRDNGRPYNSYTVEIVFTGCKIDMLKVIERVTWL